MKIAVVCAHFIPSMGYAEVLIANTLFEMGHDVHVFTTDVVPAYVTSHLQGDNYSSPLYSITRLPFIASFGQIVIPKGLNKAVTNFQPDICLIIGLGKYFPLPILKSRDSGFKKFVFIGDNANTYSKIRSGGGKRILLEMRREILKSFFKKPVYIEAANADGIFFYTPDAHSILEQWLPEKVVRKIVQKSKTIVLGFDPKSFYFSPELRKEERIRRNWSGKKVFLIATRVVQEKKLEDFVHVIDTAMSHHPDLICCITGLGKDAYGENFKKFVKSTTRNTARFHLFEFAKRQDLNSLYNASDFGFWPQAAISIREAMGTGLPVLTKKGAGIGEDINQLEGILYSELSEINFDSLLNKEVANRKVMADKAKALFSWEVLLRNILPL